MKERIKKVIKEKLEFDKIDLTDDDHIKEKLGLDSIDFLSLTVGIENEFGIEILDVEVNKENFYSLKTLEKFIGGKL